MWSGSTWARAPSLPRDYVMRLRDILPVEPRLRPLRGQTPDPHRPGGRTPEAAGPLTAPPSSIQPTLQSTKKAGSWLSAFAPRGLVDTGCRSVPGRVPAAPVHRVRRPGRARLWECAIAGIPSAPQIKEELRTARAAKQSSSPSVRWLSVQSSRLAMKWWPSDPAALPMRMSAPTSCDCAAAKNQ